MTDELEGGVEKAYGTLCAEHGPLDLFALLQPVEEVERDHWDIVLSAPYLENTLESFGVVGDALRAHLRQDDRWRIDRTLIVPADYPPIGQFLAAYPYLTGDAFVVRNVTFAGAAIRRGRFFKVTRPALVAAG